MSVTIRPHEESDVDEMTAAIHESMTDVSPWMPWCHPGYTRADAVAWVQAAKEGRIAGTAYEFAIVDASGRYAGACGINQIKRMDGVANIGYWVRSSLTGRGIAPAALQLVVHWAFENTPLNRLEVVAAVSNQRSQRVAEKAGAERDGVLRKRTLVNGQPADAVLFSFVRSD